MKKWIPAIVMCVVLCLAGFAQGEKPTIATTPIEEAVVMTGEVYHRVSDEEAEREFINGMFGMKVKEPAAMRGVTGLEGLTKDSAEWYLYYALLDRMTRVAEGTLTSTTFDFSESETADFVCEIKRADLELEEGESLYKADGTPGDKVFAAYSAIVQKALFAVLYDHPYEMYWMDKGGNAIGWYPSYATGNDSVYMSIVRIDLKISADYRAQADNAYELNTARISKVKAAVKNARKIVSIYSGLSDQYKLTAYKDAICSMTKYNYTAAYTENYPYGDPWQLVYVFDGDPTTKVVCEGYSKAFQYLCDESTWNSEVDVISVSGTMENELHMWNIVTMLGGRHFIADVTNCELGGLFLNGYTDTFTVQYSGGAEQEGYVFATGSGNVDYTYNEETINTFAKSGKLNICARNATTEENLPKAVFRMSNATKTGESLPFSVNYRKELPIYAVILDANGTEAGSFTIAADAETAIPAEVTTTTGSSALAAGTYTLCLSYSSDAAMTDPMEATQSIFHVCSGRYTAPAVSITGGETIGRELTVTVQRNDSTAAYYLDTRIITEDGAEEEGYQTEIPSGSGTWSTVLAGQNTETPGRYEVRVYAMDGDAWTQGGESAPTKAPGIGQAVWTLADTELPEIPVLSITPDGFAYVGDAITVTAEGAEEVLYSFCAFDFMGEEILRETGQSNPATGGDTFQFSTSEGPGEYHFMVRGKYNGLWSKESEIAIFVIKETEQPTNWAPIMPESIIPGQDVTVTHIPVDGAAYYDVWVYDQNGSPFYEAAKSTEPGSFVIPAAVFADGGTYSIYMGVSIGAGDDWLFGDYEYTVEPYTGGTALTITHIDDSYTEGEAATFALSIQDADKVIVQEKQYITWYPPEVYEYWDTILCRDYPGTAVTVFPAELSEVTTEHQIRMSVLKDGVWSAWSNTAAVSDPAIPRKLGSDYTEFTWYRDLNWSAPQGEGAFEGMRYLGDVWIPGFESLEEKPVTWNFECVSGSELDLFQTVEFGSSDLIRRICTKGEPMITGDAVYRITAVYDGFTYTGGLTIHIADGPIPTGVDVLVAPFDPNEPEIGEWQTAGDTTVLTNGEEYVLRFSMTGPEGTENGKWENYTYTNGIVQEQDKEGYIFPAGEERFQSTDLLVKIIGTGTENIDVIMRQKASNLFYMKPITIQGKDATPKETLPTPRISTNLTEGQDGTYGIDQGDALTVTLENPEDYEGLNGTIKFGCAIYQTDVWGDIYHGGNSTILGSGSQTLQLSTNGLSNAEAQYYLVVYIEDQQGLYEFSAADDIQFTITNVVPAGQIRFTASGSTYKPGEEYELSVIATGATSVEIYEGTPEDGQRIEWDYHPYTTVYVCKDRSGSYSYYAKAYYANSDPVVSDILTVEVATDDILADVLTVNVLTFVTPGEPFAISAADKNEATETIPDEIQISIYDEQWYPVYNTSGQNTKTITVSNITNEGTEWLENGGCYGFTIEIRKTGWEMMDISGILICKESAANQFNIAFEGTEEDHLTQYTRQQVALCIGQLPEDVDTVEILRMPDRYWSSYSTEAITEDGVLMISGNNEAGTRTNMPIIARYQTGDSYCYSNVLYADYIELGPLPAPQFSLSVTETEGAYRAQRGDIITVTLTNAEDYAGKGNVWINATFWDGNISITGISCLISESTSINLRTWELTARENPYTVKLHAYEENTLWQSSQAVSVPIYIDQGSADIHFSVNKTQLETREDLLLQVYAPGAERIEIMSGAKGSASMWTESQEDHLETSTSFSGPCRTAYYARVYYEGEEQPRETDMIRIEVTAPHGKLEDSVSIEMPLLVKPGDDITVRLASKTENSVIPENLYADIYDVNWGTYICSKDGYNTNKITLPGKDENGNNLLEANRIYRLSISAYKRGYERLYCYRTIVTGDPEASAATLTINGSGDGAALVNGKEYTATITNLPAGVTATGFLGLNGNDWEYFQEGEEKTTISHTFTANTGAQQAAICAVYTTEEISEGQSWNDIAWTGRTNAVNVTISCNHPHTSEKILWEEDTCTATDKKHHSHGGHGAKWTVCYDCGRTVGTEPIETVTSATEEHRFEGGICQDCGYICPHDAEDAGHYNEIENGTYTPKDKYTHYVRGTLHEYDYCKNCGAMTSEMTESEATTEEPHEYDNDYWCYHCGYQSTGSYLTITPTGCEENTVIDPGDSLTLGVTAESDMSSEFTYQWYEQTSELYEGTSWSLHYVPLEGETGATLTLDNIQRTMDIIAEVSDGVVSRQQGFHISIENELQLYGNTTVFATLNEAATLTMTGSCKYNVGELTYRWYHSEYDQTSDQYTWQLIDGATGTSYTTGPVTEIEEYRCWVFDPYGNGVYANITVQPDSHLTVTASTEEDTYAAPHGQASFSVTASSDYPQEQITYQWYEEIYDNEYDSWIWMPAENATGPEFTMSDITREQSVYVYVSDGNMSSTTYFHIRIDSGLELEALVSEYLVVPYGESCTLRVRATDLTGEISLVWYTYQDTDGHYARVDLGTGTTLTVIPTSNQNYYCTASNAYTSQEISINVFPDTELTVSIPEPYARNAVYGSPLELTAEVSSRIPDEQIQYQWWTADQDWNDRHEIDGANEATLHLDAVTESGYYWCEAGDGFQTDGYNDYVYVTIRTGLTVGPDGAYAFTTGEEITMQASAFSLAGAEAIRYQWYKVEDGYETEIQGANGASYTDTPNTTIEYRCVVTDGYETDKACFYARSYRYAEEYGTGNCFYPEYGDTVTLRAAAWSPNGTRFEWYKDGTIIPGASGTEYTFTATESAQYDCKVYDGDYWYGYLSYSVSVENLVYDGTGSSKVRIVPENGSIQLGLNVQTKVEGSTISYQWYRNGTEIPDSNVNPLTVAYDQTMKAAKYYCSFRSSTGDSSYEEFYCVYGEPDAVVPGETIQCGENEIKVYQLSPALSGTFRITADSGYISVYTPEGMYSILSVYGTEEYRFASGKTYYVVLDRESSVTFTQLNQEQEAFALTMLKGQRIGVPTVWAGGSAYDQPVLSIQSGDPDTVWISNGDIKALTPGTAVVTADYENGLVRRTYTITVTAGKWMELPGMLQTIEKEAFAGNRSMRFVRLPYNVQTVRSGAFGGIGDINVYIDGGSVSFEQGAFTNSNPVFFCEQYSTVEEYLRNNGYLYFYRR